MPQAVGSLSPYWRRSIVTLTLIIVVYLLRYITYSPKFRLTIGSSVVCRPSRYSSSIYFTDFYSLCQLLFNFSLQSVQSIWSILIVNSLPTNILSFAIVISNSIHKHFIIHLFRYFIKNIFNLLLSFTFYSCKICSRCRYLSCNSIFFSSIISNLSINRTINANTMFLSILSTENKNDFLIYCGINFNSINA